MMMLRLKKEIYDCKLIKEAITEYSGLTDIKYSDATDSWICTFANCKYEEAETIFEFENYLIDLANCAK
jgi:hypothetical protein